MNGPEEKFWVEINIAALRQNIRLVQEYIGAGRHILFVVKSDGYGHGAVEVARAALGEGIESFGVAILAEGLALRRAGITEEIVLLQPSLEFELAEVIAAGLQPSLSELATARRLSDLALEEPVKVHLELNTGMNRMGFDPREAVADIPRIAQLPGIHITGVFTHFQPDSPSSIGEIKKQLQLFNSIIKKLASRGVEIPHLHAASSLSILHCPESYFDTVRPGLLMYGGFNGELPPDGPQTTPVMSCRSRVLHVRRVKRGGWIHYGEVFQAPADMAVAVIAAGYGAGYPRALANVGEVLIAGRRAAICGVVGMDMTMVDVSALPPVLPGDVVTLLGRDGDEEITLAELAEKSQSIPYEIVCRLGRNLPRVLEYPEICPPADGDKARTHLIDTQPSARS